jgi:hypothetical protein
VSGKAFLKPGKEIAAHNHEHEHGIDGQTVRKGGGFTATWEPGLVVTKGIKVELLVCFPVERSTTLPR